MILKSIFSIILTDIVRGVTLPLLAAVMSLSSCSDYIDDDSVPSGPATEAGDMILFAAGSTVNSEATRSDGFTVTPGKTYYMPDSYRFVCRMYYKASATGNLYDVTGGTDVTTAASLPGHS